MASISSLTASSSLTSSLKSLSGLSSTRPLPLMLILVLVLFVTGDARVETRLAAGFNRRNRSLQGSSPLWSAELPSASQCLSACIRLGCQSLTFGHGRCELFPTFLCHPEDRFHLSLIPAAGITYFDLGSEIPQIRTLWNREGCLRYGRCLEKCSEGAWTTTASTTAAPKTVGDTADDNSHGGLSATAVPKESAVDNNGSGGLPALGVSGISSASLPGSSSSSSATSSSAGTASIKPGHSELKNPTAQLVDLASSVTSKTKPDATKVNSKVTPEVTAVPEELGARLILIQEPMTFDESLDECRRKNMSLAMPETREEHEILVEAMKKRKIGRMWIGVKKITEAGQDATYVDGRAVSTNLLLWGEGQPNNSRGKQICVEMIASLKYLWNDFDCLYKSAFVCR